MATTQAIDELETASTQMSTEIQTGQSPVFSKLPAVGKGTMVIFTPKFIIIQKDGRRFIIPRDQYEDEDQSQ